MNTNASLAAGDIIELTLAGERRTAEIMLATEDGYVLLDFFDGERAVATRVDRLEDVTVFQPDPSFVAA